MFDGLRDAPDKGVAYLRVSSDRQDLDSQRASVQGWLDRHGLGVKHWFTDVGSRDLAYKRPDFQRLLAEVEQGRIAWIVVDAKDRFGTANAWEFGKFICHLREHDCKLWSVLQGELTADDAVTEILATVDSVRSKDEQVNKAARSLRGKVAGARKGEAQGGYPPFGYDFLCVGADGAEKWRLFYDGPHRRLKIYPAPPRAQGLSQPPERYDGKGNVPARDQGDVLKLAPSCDRARVETARNVFRWFATEAISIRGLCTRLNDLRISPIIGEGWYSSRLGPMLRNPAYVLGVSVWNKNGHGRFLELTGGDYREVPRKKGRATAGRKREAGDVVAQVGPDAGIIDRETWDAVQAKLAGLHRPGKAPRNSELWLAGLLYCGRCGRRMSAWHQKSDRLNPNSYCCATYKQFGRGLGNKTGCRLHRVSARVVEPILDRYLSETGQALQQVLQVGDEAAINERADERAGEETDRARIAYLKAVSALWREVRGGSPPAGQPWTVANMGEAFRQGREAREAEVRRALADKEAELELAVENFGRLPPGKALEVARELAVKRLDRLGREVEELRARLVPLDERAVRARQEVELQQEALRAAREALAGDGNRQKAQALGRVVARLVLHFDHFEAGKTRQERSTLVRVEIEPVIGEREDFRVESQPERAYIAEVLRRTYGPTDVDQVRRDLNLNR